MNQMVNTQAALFITSIEIGILMGCVFDLIRVARKIVKHPNFLVQIEDMLYWIFCGFLGFYMLYICNYAAIRIYVFGGMILGALFYFLTFSIVFMKVTTIIINYVKALLNRLYHLMLIPIRALIRLIKRPLRYIKGKYNAAKADAYRKKRAKLRVKYQNIADQKTEQYLKRQKI